MTWQSKRKGINKQIYIYIWTLYSRFRFLWFGTKMLVAWSQDFIQIRTELSPQPCIVCAFVDYPRVYDLEFTRYCGDENKPTSNDCRVGTAIKIRVKKRKTL